MRRQGGSTGPIVLLAFLAALLAQVFAPAGASLAMARASADSPGAAIICADASRTIDKSQSPGMPLSNDECCPLCHFVHSGAAPLPPQISVLAPQTQAYSRIAWISDADVLRDGARWPHAHARAPPSRS